MGRHGERLARRQGPLWLRGRSVAAAGCALRDAQARPRPRARKGRRLEGVRPRVWTAYRGLQHGGLLPGRKGDRVLDLPHVQKEHDQELSSGPGDPRVRDKHPGLHGILSYSGYVRSHPALLLTKPLPPWELTTPPPASLLPSSATQMPSFSCSGGPSQTTSETGSSTLAFWSSTWICPIQTRTAPRSTGKDFVALAPIGVFVTLTPPFFLSCGLFPIFSPPCPVASTGHTP